MLIGKLILVIDLNLKSEIIRMADIEKKFTIAYKQKLYTKIFSGAQLLTQYSKDLFKIRHTYKRWITAIIASGWILFWLPKLLSYPFAQSRFEVNYLIFVLTPASALIIYSLFPSLATWLLLSSFILLYDFIDFSHQLREVYWATPGKIDPDDFFNFMEFSYFNIIAVTLFTIFLFPRLNSSESTKRAEHTDDTKRS